VLFINIFVTQFLEILEMATASPTPMGFSHFDSLQRRPSSSRLPYRQQVNRPYPTRAEPYAPMPAARHYTMNDSSDDEIPMPMKFSALTNALLNDEGSIGQSPAKQKESNLEPEMGYRRSGSLDSLVAIQQDHIQALSPIAGVPSPLPAKRIVRLSASSSLRRANSSSGAVQGWKDERDDIRLDSPRDVSTPAPIKRTIRLPLTASGSNVRSNGSSGKSSNRTNSAAREGELESQENPSTVSRSQLANSQGSVSRYGASAVGRSRYGDDPGLQSSMRVKRVGKVAGSFLSGPARRGRRRLDDEEQSPVEERGDILDSARATQEPRSQESQVQESKGQEVYSSQKPELDRQPIPIAYRDFASGSPIASRDSKAILSSVLRSKSPPPPIISSSQRQSATRPSSQLSQPAFKLETRPTLPSVHDQENEAPPTFLRTKQAPLIHVDEQEKVQIQRIVSPERRPLAPRSQNTPRRPAPPPPKMSLLDAATSNAGAATTAHASAKRNMLKLNGKKFTRLDCIGRGGSSKVYRVMAENSKFFALKRVNLDDADECAVRGFKGEIDLLRKLEGVDRVIRLYDYELNEEKATLSVVSDIVLVLSLSANDI